MRDVSELMKDLATRHSERHTESLGELRALAREIIERDGTDDPISSDEILAELNRLGRTPEDLKPMLQRLPDRIRHAEIVRQAVNAEADYITAADAVEAEVERFEQLRAEHEAAIAPLVVERDRQRQLLLDGNLARQSLIQNVSPETKDGIMAAVRQRREDVEVKLSVLQKERKEKISVIKRGTEADANRGSLRENKKLIAKSKKELARLDKQIADLQPELDAINRAESEALEKLLDPFLL